MSGFLNCAFFADAFLTCVSTERAVLRCGALSPVTARGRVMLERHVTTVSTLSHFHFFTSSQSRHYIRRTAPFSLGLPSCVIRFGTHPPASLVPFFTCAEQKKLSCFDLTRPLQPMLLFSLSKF